MTRAHFDQRRGVDLLWAPSDKPQPVLRVAEAVPVGFLLAIGLGLALKGRFPCRCEPPRRRYAA